MDLETLSRLQFALTAAFHYVFPPLSIGLGILLVTMEGWYLCTRDRVYLSLTRFWAKIFGLIFALGVATGIVLEFQFGTNWSTYSRFVGDVFGSALAAEGIFAFFLESGFLAVVLFGWERVSPAFHFLATVLVALGAHLSAVWIIVANSWQQTPAGYHLVETATGRRAEITDFWELVFNPSSLDRLTHALLGAWMAGAFLVVSVSAWYLLKRRHLEPSKKSLRLGLVLAALSSVLQLLSGHGSASGVAVNQPAKLAAFEGHYPASEPAELYLFGWVDEASEEVYGPSLPGLLGWMIHGDADAAVTGLRAFPPEDRPPVNLVFQAYHLMVALGLGLIGLALLALLLDLLGTLERHPFILRLLVLSVLGPQIANQVGWMAAEVGRQPWLVQGLLRTSEGFSPTVGSAEVLFSLSLFILVYLLLGALFLHLLFDKIQHGPEPVEVAR